MKKMCVYYFVINDRWILLKNELEVISLCFPKLAIMPRPPFAHWALESTGGGSGRKGATMEAVEEKGPTWGQWKKRTSMGASGRKGASRGQGKKRGHRGAEEEKGPAGGSGRKGGSRGH